MVLCKLDKKGEEARKKEESVNKCAFCAAVFLLCWGDV
jgi:hypothetical protein